MSSPVYLSMSLLGLCTVVGAGVAVGSGVAMVATAAMEEQQKMEKAPAVVTVPSPFERRPMNASFASSAREQ